MVHRAPDSRLLSSLSSHEQTYHKHLLQLLDVHAQSALSALAAYANLTGRPPKLRVGADSEDRTVWAPSVTVRRVRSA